MKVYRTINGENNPDTYSNGYYCSSSETSYYCGGDSSGFIWSNDSTRFTNNAKKLLCPSSLYWNTQSYSITTAGSTTNFNTNYMSSSVAWWYYFAYSTSAISSLTFTLSSSSYASVEVYLEKANSNYTYKGTLSSSMTVSYSSSTDKYVWLLVTPSYSNSYAYMSVYANAFSSDSSSSSSSSSNTSGSSSSDSNTIIIAIVCSVAGAVALIVAGIVGCIVYKLKSRNRQNVYLNNVNQNFHARNSRTVEYNHASHISIIFDEQSRENMNLSLPSNFQRKCGWVDLTAPLCW